MNKPFIGISASQYMKPGRTWRYNIAYEPNIIAIERAGGIPIIIPASVTMETLDAIYQRLDGVLLPGGGDVNPTIYGQEAHETLDTVDDARDAIEITLTRKAVADDLPIFGICRGIQVMNVALGGTLIQDIPSMVDNAARHTIDKATESRGKTLHSVRIEEGSRLAHIMGQPIVSVNSIHHQALGDVAPGAQVTAYSEDGLKEGIELPEKHFAMAVQWHPEDMIEDDPRMQALFDGFVEAARTRMQQ
jgi:putative glutamine amidotransferase